MGSALDAVRAAGLTGLVRRASDYAPDSVGAERLLPVLPELRPLLPGGVLRRGMTVAVHADPAGEPADRSPGNRSSTGQLAGGSASLLLALLAGASRGGSWCAVVAVPTLGALAASELGVALERTAFVPYPGTEWAAALAALLDGVDVVVAGVPGPVEASVAARLAARARQRGSVLVPYGRWPGADLTISPVRGEWSGIGQGHGRLHGRKLTVVARGRGASAVPRQVRIWLPRASGPLTAALAAGPLASVPAADSFTAALAAEPAPRLAVVPDPVPVGPVPVGPVTARAG